MTLTHHAVEQVPLTGEITTKAISTASVPPLTRVTVAGGLPLQPRGACTAVIPPDVAAQLNRIDTDLEKTRASIDIQIGGSLRQLQEHLD